MCMSLNFYSKLENMDEFPNRSNIMLLFIFTLSLSAPIKESFPKMINRVALQINFLLLS